METTSEELVVVGLGNPGQAYAMTRHNMGYLVAGGLAKELGLSFKDEGRFLSLVAKGVIDKVKVHILCPTTYMNLSGQAVRSYLDYHKLTSSHVLVIVDDVALAFGEMRLLASGGTGGHNGLKSIQAHLGTAVYKRLRIGIGSHKDEPLEDYVLSPFDAGESKLLPRVIEGGVKVVQRLLKERFAEVMSSVNERRRVEKTKTPEKQGEQDESNKA